VSRHDFERLPPDQPAKSHMQGTRTVMLVGFCARLS
jgi:hypothetical protein